jgi:hypothetical protein
LGQSNTVILCPALTSHSEMGPDQLREAGITPTTIRIALGDEDPRQLIAHFLRAAELIIAPVRPGFRDAFMGPTSVDELYERTYLDVHTRWLKSQPGVNEMLR